MTHAQNGEANAPAKSEGIYRDEEVLSSWLWLEMRSRWGVRIRLRNKTETDMETGMEIRKEVDIGPELKLEE